MGITKAEFSEYQLVSKIVQSNGRSVAKGKMVWRRPKIGNHLWYLSTAPTEYLKFDGGSGKVVTPKLVDGPGLT